MLLECEACDEERERGESGELPAAAAGAEAEAEGAREAAGRAARLASKGDVSPARAEAASSWWLERAELARCGAELLRELASGGA